MSPTGSVAAAGDFYFHIQFDQTPGGQLDDEEREMFVALFDP